jgi:hypothetical protein
MARRCDTNWREGSQAGRRRAQMLLAQMLLHLGASPAPQGRTATSDQN